MSGVILAKRSSILLLIVLCAVGASACTREKPTEPVVTTVVAQGVTPAAPAPTQLATPVGVATTGPITTTVDVTPTATLVVLPVSPVAPTLAPATPIPAAASSPGTYTVRWGDWLNKIAGQFGVTVQAIVAANPGMNPNVIYPGQVLNIPGAVNPPAGATATPGAPPAPPSGPTTYTVQQGEWFYSIARKFGVSVQALMAANPGKNPNYVFPGQVLNIPGGGTSPVPGPTPAPGDTPTPPPTSGGSYTVVRGDTLFSIAVRFHTTVYALMTKNNLASPSFIYPGQVLQIP